MLPKHRGVEVDDSGLYLVRKELANANVRTSAAIQLWSVSMVYGIRVKEKRLR